jgi:hypothetical protein
MLNKYPASVEQAMRFTFSTLNKRHRRLYAATEAIKLGHGGIAYVADLLGCHRRTVERGLRALRQGEPEPSQRARKKGAVGAVA